MPPRAADAASAAASGARAAGRYVEEAPLPRELVFGPRTDDDAQRLFPQVAGLPWIDPEAFQLGPRRRPTGPELEAAVAEAVERRRHLGHPERVVVRHGQQPHAVPDLQGRGPGGHRAVQHLGRGAMRELREEVVLDRPEVREAHGLCQHRLLDGGVQRVALVARAPGRRNRDLVEDAEVHAQPSGPKSDSSPVEPRSTPTSVIITPPPSDRRITFPPTTLSAPSTTRCSPVTKRASSLAR